MSEGGESLGLGIGMEAYGFVDAVRVGSASVWGEGGEHGENTCYAIAEAPAVAAAAIAAVHGPPEPGEEKVWWRREKQRDGLTSVQWLELHEGRSPVTPGFDERRCPEWTRCVVAVGWMMGPLPPELVEGPLPRRRWWRRRPAK